MPRPGEVRDPGDWVLLPIDLLFAEGSEGTVPGRGGEGKGRREGGFPVGGIWDLGSGIGGLHRVDWAPVCLTGWEECRMMMMLSVCVCVCG